MKQKYLLLLAIVALLIVIMLNRITRNNKANNDPSQGIPIEETENIEFVKSWVRSDRPELGRYYNYFIKDSAVIHGIPCEGEIMVDSSGKLMDFTLSIYNWVCGIPAKCSSILSIFAISGS